MNSRWVKYGPAFAALALTVLFALLGQVVLMLIFLVVGLAALAFATVKTKNLMISADPLDGLSNDSRVKLKPLLKLRGEIEQLVLSRDPSLAARVIGQEALAEANSMVEQLRSLLQLQDRTKGFSVQMLEAQTSVSQLTKQRDETSVESERENLQAAILAREAEIRHYEKVELMISQLDSKIRQAEATLSEMRARITAGAVNDNADFDQQELGQIVGRMRVLSDSFEQAEQTLSGEFK